MNKKVLLIVALFITIAGVTFFLLKPNPERQIAKSLTLLKQGDAEAAFEKINTLSTKHPLYPETLFLGYIEQARGCFDASDRFFQAALLEAHKRSDEGLLAELSLAKAASSYLMRRDNEFFYLVESARKTSPENPALRFFEGVEKYMQQNYAEAFTLWNRYSAESVGDWMAYAIDTLFPKIWKKMHIAHCLIEEGDFQAAREILEKEEHTLDFNNLSMRHLANLFLGLSYLGEAGQVPFDQRDSFYKLAHFYFERAHVANQKNDPYFREKALTIVKIAAEAKGLLLVDADEAKRKWAFDFIHILQDWKATVPVELLSDAMAASLLKQKSGCDIAFCEALRKEFIGTPFHEKVTRHVLNELSRSLKEGETDNLIGLWNLVEGLVPNPRLAAKEIASLTSEEILETIKLDDSKLLKTRRFIAFWEKLGRSEQEREMLARDLLVHAKLFWHNEKQEKKGRHLMEIAIKLSDESPFIEKEISNFLTRLYVLAESSNMIRRLSLIYDAFVRFEINHQELVSRKTLANHLADAEYLYQSHNYPAAKTHANWVLKLEPQNENARRLAGLSAFHLGDYTKALAHLQDLQEPDEDSRKALMLSQVFASQKQGRHLCQSNAADSFDEQVE